MDEIKFRAIVDDSDVERFMNDAISSGQGVQDTFDQIGTAAQKSTDKMVQGLKDTEREIINATRAADDYKRQIRENEQAIDRLNKQQRQEQLLLKQLQKEYKQLGDQGSKSAQTLKGQIDALDTSIKTAANDTEILALKNKVLRDDLAKTGKGFALNKQQAANLTFQLNDLFVQLASGQGVIRPLIQQGPQITQIFGGFSNTMKAAGAAAKNAFARVVTLRGGLALLSGGLIALVAIPLIAFFTKSEKAADFLGNKIAYLSGWFSELGKRILNVGEALFDWITRAGTFRDVTNAMADSVTGLGAAMDEAGRKAQQLRLDVKALEQSQLAYLQAEERINTLIAERRRLADDESRAVSERIRSERAARALEQVQQKAAIANAKEELRIAREKGVQGKELIELQNNLTIAQRNLTDAEFQSEQRLAALRQTAIDQARERREALAELAREAQKLRDRLFEAQNADATGLDKIRFDAIQAAKELDRLEESLRSLYAERGRAFDLETEFNQLRAIHAERTARQIEDYANQETIARRRALEQQSDAEDAAFQRELQTLDRKRDLAILLSETRRRDNQTEIEAEAAKEREKLTITRQFEEARLELIEQYRGPASEEAAITRAQIELYRQQYETLASTDLTGLEAFAQKVRDALGLTPADLQAIGQMFGQIGSYFTEAITSVTEAQIEAQQNRIDMLRDQVAETESALEEQLRLQEQGYANDADLLKQNLTARQTLLEEAEAKKLQLEKKAARQRLAIDVAQQASAYVGTVINLLNSGARGGVVGLLAAIGGVALIAKTIAQARATAKQFEPPGFRDGTPYLDGPGDGRSDSILIRAAKGERITSAAANAAIGGRDLSEADMVKYIQLGKLASLRPDFAETDAKTAGVVIEHKRLTATERAQQQQMMREAYQAAADRTANKMIGYWKTRPVTKLTPDGEVIEFYEGGTKVRQNVKKR